MEVNRDSFQQCRFCSAMTDLVVPIFAGEGTVLSLDTKITRHLPIHVSSGDSLPQGVCYPCVETLLNWDSFVNMCVDTESKLRSLAEVPSTFEFSMEVDLFSQSDEEPLNNVKSENEKNLEKSEADTEETDGKFICSCGKSFKGQKGLSTHAYKCKKSGDLTCNTCGITYKQRASLLRHKEREHLSAQSSCPVCHILICSQRLKSHLKTMHNVTLMAQEEAKFKCKYCSEMFKSKYLRNDHVKKVHDSETVKCESCDFEGVRKMVKRHSRTAHGEKSFQCPQCPLAFKTMHLLKLHSTSHSDLRCYTCDICGMGFKRLNNVRDHMKCHKEKSNQCQICGNFFARKRYLAMHEKTVHNFFADGSQPEKKGFECSVCGAKLKWKKNLMAHMRIHTGEKPYECKVCLKTFMCHGTLRTHMHKHDTAPVVLATNVNPEMHPYSVRVMTQFDPQIDFSDPSFTIRVPARRA